MNSRQRHGRDIQLGMLDQLQQQVKWPFIYGDVDGVPAALVAEHVLFHGLGIITSLQG